MSKINIEENLRYQYISDASSLHTAIHFFKLNKSTDEKGQMLDMLIIRRLEEMRNTLLIHGLKHIKDVSNITDEDIRKLFEKDADTP